MKLPHERGMAAREGSLERTAMQAQIGRFSRVALLRSPIVAPGPSATVCLPASDPKSGPRSAHTAIQYRRGTTRTGELDGAKEADGG